MERIVILLWGCCSKGGSIELKRLVFVSKPSVLALGEEADLEEQMLMRSTKLSAEHETPPLG